jgi:hypothetical protein
MSDDFRSEFHESVFDSTGKRDESGPSPGVHDIDRIVKIASRCNKLKYDEGAWFACVHARLLVLALENDVWDGIVDWVPWYVP